MTVAILTKSANLLTDRGYTQATSAHDDEDHRGVTHTIFDGPEGNRFHVRAKAELYEATAPFGKDHCEKAINDNAYVMIYYDDTGDHWVFDPDHVRKECTVVKGRSKRSESRVWYEVGLDHGVPLDHFESGARPRSSPEIPDDTTVPGPSGGGWSNSTLEDYIDG